MSPAGIHGPRTATTETRSLRDAGYRVKLGDDAAQTDVTDRVSGLRYASRLPGGYADCSFTLEMPLRETTLFLYPLAYLAVYFRGQLAWEGRVEEAPRGTMGTTSMTVSGLGKGAALRSRRRTAAFVDSGYDRWRPAWEVVSGSTNTAPRTLTFSSPAYAPDSNVNPGVVVGWPDDGEVVTNDSYAWLLLPPPGTLLRRVKGSVNAVGAWTDVWILLGAEDTYKGNTGSPDETVVADRTLSSGDTTFDDTLSAARVALRAVVYYTGAGGTFNTESKWHLHSMKYTTELDAEGEVLDVDAVTPYEVIRSVLAQYTGGVVQSSGAAMFNAYTWAPPPNFLPGADLDATYVFDSLVFDAPTTPEDMIVEANKVVGWEWGVFEDGLFYYGPLSLVTTVGPGSAFPTGYPPWWCDCRAEDGHEVQLAASLTDTYNAVAVAYQDETGTAALYEATDYTNGANPLNNRDGSLPPREVREGSVTLPGTSTAADAAAAGAAFLADRGRAQVKGEVTWNSYLVPKVEIGQGGRGNLDTGERSPEFVATPLIRPGWWVQVSDALQSDRVARVVQDDRYPSDANLYGTGVGGITFPPLPDDLLPVRAVEVDADAGTVRCSLDSTRDLFAVQLARLSQAAS